MADERTRASQDMMQQALDGQLPDEMTQKLAELLHSDHSAAREFNRMQRVDALLKRAPHKRAPARLAATIMARVAEHMRAETELAGMSPEAQRLMMLSLSAAMMAMMPMMEAASWLVLNARREPELLSTVMLETVGWVSLVTDALIQLLQDAESLARSEPEVATATLALTPYLLSSVLDYLEDLPIAD